MSIKDATVMPVLAVDDIERAIGFYQDTLGCSIERFRDGRELRRTAEFGRGQRILLYKSTMRRGETTAAALVVDDVESTVDELRGRGIVFENYDMPGLKTDQRHSSATATSRQPGSRTPRAT